MEVAAKHIAVIGGGISGLISIKECIEEGFQVTCYEKQTFLGGLWRYRDEDIDGIPSVMRSTIINSSKEMSALSDFPPPAEFPNYMHNSKMIEYIELYAKHFKVQQHVKFGMEVVEISKAYDFDLSGRWNVKVRGSEGVSERLFDGVMVCTGHHVYPKVAEFPGLDKFQGRVIHTHSYKKPAGFEDSKVLVVGVGNSGGDVAVELSHVAESVYLSTRSGCWVMSRVGPNGMPFDAYAIRRHFEILANCFPRSAVNSYFERVLSQKFRHGIYNLKPKHTVTAQHPMINDILPDKILTGTVIIKNNIHHFTSSGVVFVGEEDKQYDLDDVVMATGYLTSFPFLSKDIIDTSNNECYLYKYMLPPQFKHPTLAFIGLVQPVGPLIPISELQVRWYVELMSKRVKLPSETEMNRDIQLKRKVNAKRYISGTRHTIEVDFLPFMDEIASQIGVKPDLFNLMISDPKLFWACLTGPVLPYQYRLQGPKPWNGARDAIVTYDERVLKALNTRVVKTNMQNQVKSTKLAFNTVLFLVSVYFIFAILF